MKNGKEWRSRLIGYTALASGLVAASPAMSQDTAESGFAIGDIIVTAQKREQSLQDVPIAVTAISSEVLEANRATNVIDLSALAPGLVLRTTPGGAGIPTYGMRGAQGNSSVIGADKQVSLYLDGVYLAGTRGSIFDLPDVDRIEVLRGPQGTLFGRNATAGAISVTTREPTGEARVRADGTLGNRDHYRFRLSGDLPQMGPVSAYFSYLHQEYRGSIRNAGPPVVWDRTSSLLGPYYVKSAKWLGSKNSDSYFASVKLEPSDDFKLVYKFDRNETTATPAGIGFTGYDENYVLSPIYEALFDSLPQPPHMAADQRRPDIVNNSYSGPGFIMQEGHSLTAEYAVNDSLSIKNIAAYRKSSSIAQASLVGIDALPTTLEGLTAYSRFLIAPRTVPGWSGLSPEARTAANANVVQGLIAAGWLGAPFVFVGTPPQARHEQWSNELQITYISDFLTLTSGALYFKSKDWVGEHGYATESVTIKPGNAFPVVAGPQTHQTESIAAYAQGEIHVTPKLDLMLGGRVTRDKKGGITRHGDPAGFSLIESSFKDTRFNYMIGVNYKPNDDILLYGKWSTAYMSGGAVGPIAYEPETVKSVEAGGKADLFNGRLRVNAAVFWAEYKDYQTAQSTSTLADIISILIPDPAVADALRLFVFPQGDVEATGLELEVTAAPTRGVTLGGSLSYTDTKFHDVPDFIKRAQALPLDTPDSEVTPTLRPKWTGTVWGQFDSPVLFGDTYLSLRADGIYQSKVFARSSAEPQYAAQVHSIPGYWLVNGRVSLRDLNLGGLKADLAVWGRNLFDEDVAVYPIDAAGLSGTSFLDARSYGLDLTIEF